MAKPSPQLDVLVLGDHPCAYLAAALLKQTGALKVAHALLPGDRCGDRLVMINPHFFELHDLLSPLKRKLDMTSIYGLKFLADDPATFNAQVNKTICAYVGSLKQIHGMVLKIAEEAEVPLHKPSDLQIRQLDESGARLELNGAPVHTKLIILAGELRPEQKQMLGLAPAWERQVVHRYTFLKVKAGRLHDAGNRPIIPMSLDLRGTLNWAWLLPGPGGMLQIAIEQPIESVQQHPPHALLKHWIEVLSAHGVIKSGAGAGPNANDAVSLDLPLGGALAQEGVANRTLLIGPAGGFYTACAEDVYPTCWSAIHACEVAKKALKEPHLQDALQPYRLRWGAALGDYLRGPQQNLRFLLPLVYRNHTMTARLAEAIFFGKSVVR